MPTLEDYVPLHPDYVRATNTGDTVFSAVFTDSRPLAREQRYTINPGQTKTISWEQLCVWFGDPSIQHGSRDHASEMRRLNAQYLVSVSDSMTAVTVFPEFTFTDPDTDARIFPLISNLDGEHTQSFEAPANDPAALEHRVRVMAAQLAALQAQLSGVTPTGPFAEPAELVTSTTEDGAHSPGVEAAPEAPSAAPQAPRAPRPARSTVEDTPPQ